MPNVIKTQNDQLPHLYIESIDTTTYGPTQPTRVYAERIATSIVGSNGLEAMVNPDTTLRVQVESHSLFNDSLDALDTTARWTTRTGSGGTAATSGGALNLSSSTTASAFGGVFTKASFSPPGVNNLIWGAMIRVPVALIANTYRFWGLGTIPATPTVATPVTDGYGWELDGTGTLNAVIYRGGVRTLVSPISPAFGFTQNVYSRFAIRFRADAIFFYVNDLNNPAAASAGIGGVFPELNTTALPISALCVNAASAPAQAATLNITAIGIGDTGANNNTLSDSTNPWIQANVKDSTVEVTPSDRALVVAQRLPVDPIQFTGVLTTNTPVAVAAAGAAGIRNYCESLSFQNTSATATTILLQDGGTTIAQWNAPASMVTPYYHNFVPPIRTTAATALNINCGTTGANVLTNISGFRA